MSRIWPQAGTVKPSSSPAAGCRSMPQGLWHSAGTEGLLTSPEPWGSRHGFPAQLAHGHLGMATAKGREGRSWCWVFDQAHWCYCKGTPPLCKLPGTEPIKGGWPHHIPGLCSASAGQRLPTATAPLASATAAPLATQGERR